MDKPQLHKMRIGLDHFGGVGEAAQGGGLAPGLFENRQPFLAGADHLGKNLFQLARKQDVLDMDRDQVQAEVLRFSFRHCQQFLGKLAPAVQNGINIGGTDDFPQGDLQFQIERVLKVLRPVGGRDRISDFVMGGQADFQRHAIRTQHFLAGDRNKPGSEIEFLDEGQERGIPVLPRSQRCAEPALAIQQSFFVVENRDPPKPVLDQQDQENDQNDA